MTAFFSATMRSSLRDAAAVRVAWLSPFLSRVAVALAIPLLLYVAFATTQKALDAYRMGQQARALQTEIIALRDENLLLQREIEEARSNVAVETIAREQLGLVKPGDHAIVLQRDPAGKPLGRVGPAPVHAEPWSCSAGACPPPWQQWWSHFFGGSGTE